MKYYFLFLLVSSLMSCDVPGVIEVKNKLDENIKVTCSFKNQNEYSQIHINEIQPKQVGYVMLGFSTRWDKAFVDEYRTKIDTIYLKVGKIDYVCYSSECKEQLFNLSNRKSKRKMSIDIDSSLLAKTFSILTLQNKQ
ncbi:hypothetical protein ACE193_06295 [Bernardetia sp. OM2101]|uniref:hypothetical protein n=1 Tax=Bernardetia sp. OM2101 TaxID=3344876 RepID=UPI0035D00239